ncbi:MAG: ribosome-binding factor A [Candidatus Omnitrophica bacterium CG1_02_46_14]|nr:MAG: ribosome-binding factor A [Candidatus Omnitrophica bacterium CG1_02_46_14]
MSQRSEQVAEELRKIISVILLEDINDPRKGFITITRIALTSDLRFARIFYSVLGDDATKENTRAVLEENAGYIRKLAAEQINMKYAIELKFELDKSIEHSFHIDEVLKKLKKNETVDES